MIIRLIVGLLVLPFLPIVMIFVCAIDVGGDVLNLVKRRLKK